MHFFSTCMVSLGSIFSAVWILVANSWQQTPAGHHIVEQADGTMRAEITDFWAMVFNPSTVDRFTHTVSGALLTGAFVVLSVSAFYLLRRRHEEFACGSLKIGLVVAVLASLTQLLTGHSSAVGVSENQPMKLAAFEGHYPESAPADLYLVGWVDEANESVSGIRLPGMTSWLVGQSISLPVAGLRSVPPEDRPPVNMVFQTYHGMIAIGMVLIALSLLGVFFWWRGSLFEQRWLLWAFVPAVLLPQFANQLGWISAEVGRQPWIVYGLLRTEDGLSQVINTGHTLFSMIAFTLVYLLLFVLFIFLLNQKIQHGPEALEDEAATYGRIEGALDGARPEAGA
jgi:cytochrome d ubiquinol oxidase subunit I